MGITPNVYAQRTDARDGERGLRHDGPAGRLRQGRSTDGRGAPADRAQSRPSEMEAETERTVTVILQEKLSRERFRELYADRKPAFELIDGSPEQKARGSKKHSVWQWILGVMLGELGFQACPELTLAISETWEPIPDLAGLLAPETDELYQSQPPAVVIEILSPSDRFTLLDEKCRKYSDWGVPDILVFDPVRRRAWRWDRATDGLARFETYRFSSHPDAELSLLEVFQRLDQKRGCDES